MAKVNLMIQVVGAFFALITAKLCEILGKQELAVGFTYGAVILCVCLLCTAAAWVKENIFDYYKD